MNDRKPFLNNIRMSTVLLVIFYHVAYLWNGVGILGGIPNAESLPLFDLLAALIYPWFMVLLFLVAGITAKYSLSKRAPREFLRERTRKLLIPSTAGLFVFHWITGYLNIKLGGGLETIPRPLRYPIAAISGIGPLWFAQMLFLFSAVLLLFRKLDKRERLWHLSGKTPFFAVFLFPVLLWGASFVGNLPVLTMYRFGIYLCAFFLGYLVFSHEKMQASLKKAWLPLAVAAAISLVPFGFYAAGKDYTASAFLQSPVTALYLWLMILMILFLALRFEGKGNRFTAYLTQNSFAYYVLHYPVLLAAGYLLEYKTSCPVLAKYALALLITLAGTALLCEIIKRIPVLRLLVLGIGKK